MLFNFLRNKNCVNRISSRNSTFYNFLIKIYLESFAFSYQFSIYLGSSTKVLFTASTSHWTSGSSVKFYETTLSDNDCWVPSILSCSLTYCFSSFSVIVTFGVTSCIFVLKCFNHSNSFVPLPVFLRHYVGHDKIKWKLWSDESLP